MTDVVKLNVADERQVYSLVEAICLLLDNVQDEIVMPALADVVAICCEIADDNNPEAILDTLYERTRGQFHMVYAKRATPKPDNVIPLTRSLEDE